MPPTGSAYENAQAFYTTLVNTINFRYPNGVHKTRKVFLWPNHGQKIFKVVPYKRSTATLSIEFYSKMFYPVKKKTSKVIMWEVCRSCQSIHKSRLNPRSCILQLLDNFLHKMNAYQQYKYSMLEVFHGSKFCNLFLQINKFSIANIQSSQEAG